MEGMWKVYGKYVESMRKVCGKEAVFFVRNICAVSCVSVETITESQRSDYIKDILYRHQSARSLSRTETLGPHTCS